MPCEEQDVTLIVLPYPYYIGRVALPVIAPDLE
jgi:hypothetical protein